MLEIYFKTNTKNNIFLVNKFWLRDHCRCEKCYNYETKQRKYNLFDIPENIDVIELNYSNNDETLEIKWSDDHQSTYDIGYLYSHQLSQVIARSRSSTSRIPWNYDTIIQNERSLHISLEDLMKSDDRVTDLVAKLVQYGIVFIDDVPPNTAMTELAIRHVFPIMRTFFGEMWSFSDVKDHADTAYTREYLGSHTDNSYFYDAAGLQALHCIEHLNADGGENFFVDGLYTALKLKQQNSRAFDLLSKVQIPAEYIEDGQYHYNASPMINLDPITGEIMQLRLNVYDRAIFDSIEQAEMEGFYKCFRDYLKIVQNEKNQFKLKLSPGTIVIFDNWRVYHGRFAYSGSRTMTGCYVQRTDFMSKARILGLID